MLPKKQSSERSVCRVSSKFLVNRRYAVAASSQTEMRSFKSTFGFQNTSLASRSSARRVLPPWLCQLTPSKETLVTSQLPKLGKKLIELYKFTSRNRTV